MFRHARKTRIQVTLIALLMLVSVNSVQANTYEELTLELTTVKLSKTQPVLEKLAQTKDENLLALFETLLAGNLHYNKETRALVKIEKTGDVTAITDFNTGESLNITKKEASKIRVNNRLRTWLRGAIARIQLTSENPKERLAAVEALYKKSDKAVIATVKELHETETDKNVLQAMDIVLAMDAAVNANDESEQLNAIRSLTGNLHPPVRNLLVKLSQQNENTTIANEAEHALQTIEGKVNFYSKIDTLFFGLSLGSVLLLASIGLAITFGVMGVINMAHGEMIMLGAYTTYVVQLLMPNHIDASLWVAIPAAFIVSGFMGILIERGVIQFLHGRPLETLLATFGISLILQQLVRTVFSPLNRQVDTPSWMSGSIELNPVLFLTLNRFYIFIFALIVFALLVVILNKTNLGLHVRAVSQNRNMAKAMGIKTARVDALTFGLGSGIAGIAGVALSQLTNVGPNLGQGYIIDSFMVVVFGGVGNLFGTLVAAFTLGIANKVFEPITGAVLASILVLVFIILFIQKRPKGLFPQKGRAAE